MLDEGEVSPVELPVSVAVLFTEGRSERGMESAATKPHVMVTVRRDNHTPS